MLSINQELEAAKVFLKKIRAERQDIGDRMRRVNPGEPDAYDTNLGMSALRAMHLQAAETVMEGYADELREQLIEAEGGEFVIEGRAS